jgi:hypothetical protein
LANFNQIGLLTLDQSQNINLLTILIIIMEVDLSRKNKELEIAKKALYAFFTYKALEPNNKIEKDYLVQKPVANPYQTIYREEVALHYFDDFGMLRGFTRMNGKWVSRPISENYGRDADDTILHEVNGHNEYNTGDEGTVRSRSSYLQATGKKPDPYMNSY